MRTISSPRRITGLLTDKSDKAASVYDCPNSLTAIHDSSMARLRDRCSRRLCTASSLAYSPRRACTSPRPMAARSTRRACVTGTRRRHHRGQHIRATAPASVRVLLIFSGSTSWRVTNSAHQRLAAFPALAAILAATLALRAAHVLKSSSLDAARHAPPPPTTTAASNDTIAACRPSPSSRLRYRSTSCPRYRSGRRSNMRARNRLSSANSRSVPRVQSLYPSASVTRSTGGGTSHSAAAATLPVNACIAPLPHPSHERRPPRPHAPACTHLVH